MQILYICARHCIWENTVDQLSYCWLVKNTLCNLGHVYSNLLVSPTCRPFATKLRGYVGQTVEEEDYCCQELLVDGRQVNSRALVYEALTAYAPDLLLACCADEGWLGEGSGERHSVHTMLTSSPSASRLQRRPLTKILLSSMVVRLVVWHDLPV
jgi:hypothetical protein